MVITFLFHVFVEQQSKKKKKGVCGFFRRTWKAVRRSALHYQRGNKVAPDPFAIDPVATRDPADLQPVLFSINWPKLNAEPTYLEPSSVPGPSILNNEPMPAPRQSDCEPADGRSTVTTFIIVVFLLFLLFTVSHLYLCS